MNGFWIAGIAVNLIALAVVLAWAVRAWRQSDAARRTPDDTARDVDPHA